MKDFIDFEKSLFGDNPVFLKGDINNLDFWVDRIVHFPSIRPFYLDHLLGYCQEWCQIEIFRARLLERAIIKCPVLIYRLYQNWVFHFNEIEPHLRVCSSCIPNYYFWREIPDFKNYIIIKRRPRGYNGGFFNLDNVDLMIQFGFLPSSIEYCLKYDDFEVLQVLLSQNIDKESAKWSPFEWSKEPKSLDFLSISGFFGSIRCFKHLLVSGYECKNDIRSFIVCSGNTELYHMSFDIIENSLNQIMNAAEFYRISFLEFLFENGTNIDSKNSIMISCFIMSRPFV